MKIIFRFQDVVEIVCDGVPALEVNANDIQKVVYKAKRKKDGKALFLIHQCVDPNVFKNIIEEETSKMRVGQVKELVRRRRKTQEGEVADTEKAV